MDPVYLTGFNDDMPNFAKRRPSNDTDPRLPYRARVYYGFVLPPNSWCLLVISTGTLHTLAFPLPHPPLITLFFSSFGVLCYHRSRGNYDFVGRGRFAAPLDTSVCQRQRQREAPQDGGLAASPEPMQVLFTRQVGSGLVQVQVASSPPQKTSNTRQLFSFFSLIIAREFGCLRCNRKC